jgi:hypothetical protein
MHAFESEFRNFRYVIRNAERILLFAHTRPDADTVGANVALLRYLSGLGKKVEVACFDPIPDFGRKLFPDVLFSHPDHLPYGKYDAAIASDSINRGFDRVLDRISERTVTVLIDHHPIDNGVDPLRSAVRMSCERFGLGDRDDLPVNAETKISGLFRDRKNREKRLPLECLGSREKDDYRLIGK